MTRWYDDGRLHLGLGIEDTFIPQEKPGHRRLDEYELTKHYEHWHGDLGLAAQAGADYVRWGVPWYRVEPEPGVFDFSWVDQVASRFAELGLRCVVDLMHYGTPLWLTDSFVDPDYPRLVARYAAAVGERYRGVFTDYTPLNEPIINALWCGRDGRWPPYLTGLDGFARVLIPLVKGMIATSEALRGLDADIALWQVEAGMRFDGERFPVLPRDVLDAYRTLALDLQLGRVTRDTPMYQWLISAGVQAADLDAFAAQSTVPDVLGLNYYPGFTTVAWDEDGREHPVEAGTAGLEELVRLFHDRYGLPLAITETSRSETDAARKVAWLDESLATVDALRAQGIPLLGYTWFPFLDLYNWDYREGTDDQENYHEHFGLVTLTPRGEGDLRRDRNVAFDTYREHAARTRNERLNP